MVIDMKTNLMIKYMMALGLWCITILVAQAQDLSQAQVKDLAGSGIMLRGPRGVVLWWQDEVLSPASPKAAERWQGYIVYRKGENDPNFVRITPTPVSLPVNAQALKTIAGQGNWKRWMAFLQVDDDLEVWNLIMENKEDKVGFLLLLDPYLPEAVGLRFWDLTAKQGETYMYRVVRISASGNESPAVLRGTVLAPSVTPPHPPQNLKINYRNGTVRLDWQPSRSELALYYHVYRSEEPEYGFIRINPDPIIILRDEDGNALTSGFTDAHLETGTSYYYQVRATDVADNLSNPSETMSVNIPTYKILAAPDSVGAKSVQEGILLKWRMGNDMGAPAFHIIRKPLAKTALEASIPGLNDHFAEREPVRITKKPLTGDARSYIDTTPIPGIPYAYGIVALAAEDSDDAIAQSEIAQATWVDNPPALPVSDLIAEPHPEGIAVSWSPIRDATGYLIFRSIKNANEGFELTQNRSSDTLWVDKSDFIKPGYPIWYRIVTVDGRGIEGKPSIAVAGMSGKAIRPDKPSFIHATKKTEGVEVMWDPPFTRTMSSFILERNTGEGFIALKEVMADSMYLYLDLGMKGKAKYRVLAKSPEGILSEPSGEIEVDNTPAPPFLKTYSPKDVKAYSEKGKIFVVWKPDGVVESFRILRYSSKNPTPETVAQLVGTAMEYQDTKTQAGTTYYYQVEAIGPNLSVKSKLVWIQR